MSPRKQPRSASEPVTAAVNRLWILFGQQVRDARLTRRWSVAELARHAGLSPSFVYLIEAGGSGSAEGAARIAHALGLRVQLELINPRQRADSRPTLSVDLVHSAMGEFETAHMRGLGVPSGIDEPYQHYQFAGRADVVAWDLARAALLHIENRTRFPDFQDMAGAFNQKRAYLADSLGERLGVRRWASQTHVIAALWSSEVLHALRLRQESFRSLCPDPTDHFEQWWAGTPPTSGKASALVVLDPLATGRQREYISLDDALTARPRYRGYADAAARVLAGAT
jgi:transcriptional regulator with XRE-family HTH domain